MDQVVRGVDAVHRTGQRGGVQRISGERLRLRSRTAGERLGAPSQTPHSVPIVSLETVEQAAAHVARRAREQDGLLSGVGARDATVSPKVFAENLHMWIVLRSIVDLRKIWTVLGVNPRRSD